MFQPYAQTITGLVASKNATAAIVATVQSLFDGGADKVIVIDDGSDDPASAEWFDRCEALDADVIHLPANVGKSNALRAGFAAVPEGSYIVQVDDDTLAGNLLFPAKMITTGKAHIVDIRVETTRTKSLVGLVQELNYWMTNAFVKRIQDVFHARLWMSGASVMYTYEAGKVLLLEQAHTMTEDTEGLYRARTRGFEMRYCSAVQAQFTTMVPETVHGLRKQWQRWATGSGQVMGRYGLGGGQARITVANILSWLNLLLPIPLVVINPEATLMWALAINVAWGIFGACYLRRPRVLLVGVLLPLLSIGWAYCAYEGLWLAWRRHRTGATAALTWTSPARVLQEA